MQAGDAGRGSEGLEGRERGAERWEQPDIRGGGGAEAEPLGLVPESAASGASQPYVGRWNQLVSTTNWEKGRIILEWREALSASAAPVTEYSDEAWAGLVGGVTAQHVGRLRRVYARFGTRRDVFPGLFWSHFHAAIDWEDAEMWLEGAVHSRWSVSQMRRQRWETLGAIAADRPRDEDVITSELDEDAPAQDDTGRSSARERLTEIPAGPAAEGPDFGEEPGADEGAASPPWEEAGAAEAAAELPAVRPFENLPALPDDVADALERFKLALLHHKTDGWRDISCADLCAVLEALKSLALAP